jgi:hypothetical protein
MAHRGVEFLAPSIAEAMVPVAFFLIFNLLGVKKGRLLLQI